MNEPALRLLLDRLAAAAGVIVFLPLLATTTSVADAAGGEQVCVDDSQTDGACPDASQALSNFQDQWVDLAECPVVAVASDGVAGDAGQCCYTVQIDCADTGWGYSDKGVGGGCMGRPFVEEGRVVAASVQPRAARVRGPLPTLAGLDASRRARLTEFWLRVGLAEHASIAEFHRVALELIRFGAPTELLARAQLAAVDEARHARRCFLLASAYAGVALEAGPLPIAAHVVLAPDLVALATATARDGCVAETCSVWLYRSLGQRAQDPAVKRVIEGVVRDETRHAELAWATLRWAISRGGRDVRDAAWQALSTPPPNIGDQVADDPLLAAHGWAPGQVQDAITMDVWRRLVLPLGHQLCA